LAEPLKNLLGPDIVRDIAREIAGASSSFAGAKFIAACLDGLDRLELSARAAHIADAMHHHLPRSFPAAAEVLLASLGPEAASDGSGVGSLRYWPHATFVQKYGLDDFEAAMAAQYEITRRFSAEFSIRAFLVRHPERTHDRLLTWAHDENVHVRRLVSEGTRPRLPWAPRLRAYQEDPRPVIRLLELLKDDRERYVQRSVANNLNDISKDHPDLALEICCRWLAGASPQREWIVRHALRSLVKKGHKGALAALGAGAKPDIRIRAIRLAPSAIKLGGELKFSFEIASTGKRPQQLLIDYVVHFIKANGKARPKVFKLRRLLLPPGGRAQLAGAVSFAQMTTRRHYPGLHRIEALINGIVHPLASFELRPQRMAKR
jgi:3-methyladenine DNA glycosylase AlkC